MRDAIRTSIITLYTAPIRSTDFSVGWRTEFFKIMTFAGKCFLSLLPPPPYSIFCSIIPSPSPLALLFHSFPFLALQNYQNLVLRSFSALKTHRSACYAGYWACNSTLYLKITLIYLSGFDNLFVKVFLYSNYRYPINIF